MSEEKQVEMWPVFDTLDRLYREGNRIVQYTPAGSIYLTNAAGGIVMSGRSFRDLCVNIILAGL